jgi:hypothetical protein
MKLGAMTGFGCTQGIEPELWKKREQKESMRRVENKKRSGRTKSAAALPDRSANAEGWPKPNRADSGEKRRGPNDKFGKRFLCKRRDQNHLTRSRRNNSIYPLI